MLAPGRECATGRIGCGERRGMGKLSVDDAIGAMLWLAVLAFCAALIADAFSR